MRKLNTVITKYSMMILLFISSVLTGSAAEGDDNSLLKPGMGMAWFNQQPQDFKDMIYWIFGLLIFAVGAIFLLSSGAVSAKGMAEKGFGDPEGRSSSNKAIIGILFTLVGLVIFISLGTKIFKFF